MNRFKEIIDDLSKRRSDVVVKDILPTKDSGEHGREREQGAKGDEKPKDEAQWRLPYSSDPVPIDEPWAN